MAPAIVRLQMVANGGVGDEGANAYARASGIKPEEFLARFAAGRCAWPNRKTPLPQRDGPTGPFPFPTQRWLP
jgi:hypothetical protein